MSIATLKRKTQTLYNNMSVGSKDGFSINGIYRNQGYVGQTSLSRSLPRTPMKGPTPKGHGGCCGTYLQTHIVQSGVTSPENNVPGSVDAIGEQYRSKVKTSTMNTGGMILSKYRWARRGQPITTVKPDCNHGTNQSLDIYTQNKAKNTLNDVALCDANNGTVPVTKVYSAKDLYFCSQYSRRNFNRALLCKTTKPANMISSVSNSEYILQLDSSCINSDKVFPSHNQGGPLPGN
jgi:hypothetical protein